MLLGADEAHRIKKALLMGADGCYKTRCEIATLQCSDNLCDKINKRLGVRFIGRLGVSYCPCTVVDQAAVMSMAHKMLEEYYRGD